MTLAASSTNSFSALFASLKFGIKNKSTKYDLSDTSLTSLTSSPKATTRQPVKGRRQAMSLDFSTAAHAHILDELIEIQQLENEAKKRHGLLTRKISFPKRCTSVYNNDESLHNAVMVGNVELTRQVLNDNVDINSFLPPGWTPLHHACRIGDVKMIKLLLEFGADASLVNDEGSTSLRVAVTCGNFDAAACLIHDGGVSCEEIRNGFQSTNKGKGKSSFVNESRGKLKKMKSIDVGTE